MANERTFLSWMRSFVPIAMMGLMAIKMGLIIEGIVFVVLSIFGVVYAARRYLLRYSLMQQKVADHALFHDSRGVLSITILFLGAMAIAMFARLAPKTF